MDARDLAEVGDGPRRAGVHLYDVELPLVDEVLDVHEPARAESKGEAAGAVCDVLRHLGREAARGIDGDGVAGVDARTLDVLHDAEDEHTLSFRDAVSHQLNAGHVQLN